LLVGAPGAGKSTLVRELRLLCESIPSHLDFDEHVLRLARARDLKGDMPDAVIDEALDEFLNDIAKNDPCIVELPYHDYVGIVTSGKLALRSFGAVVVLTAPISLLIERDAERRMHVPLPYIARCVGSATALSTYLSVLDGTSWLVLDTSLFSPGQQAEVVTDFIRRKESESLRKLSIAPSPLRPDIGGNLRHSVEWDDELVQWLVARFGVRTALDVGCGSGLSLEAFSKLGVAAWGIDANPQVLLGPSHILERLLIADFTRHWVEWPTRPDLVWCVEVIEHVSDRYEDNILRTICHNTGRVAFVSTAPPGQQGYHHVNCKPRDYWIREIEGRGLSYLPEAEPVLARLKEGGPFSRNFLKHNGMMFLRNA
jgi:SAM-dependent methyltransferase